MSGRKRLSKTKLEAVADVAREKNVRISVLPDGGFVIEPSDGRTFDADEGAHLDDLMKEAMRSADDVAPRKPFGR